MRLFAHSLQTFHIFICSQMLVIKAGVTPRPVDIRLGSAPANAATDCISTLLPGGMRAHCEYTDGVEAFSVIQIKVAARKLRKMSCIKLLDLWI